MIVSFFGHSNYFEKNDDKEKLLNYLIKIIDSKDVEFYLGGYGSFDCFAKSCCLKYKEMYKNSKIVYVSPYLNCEKLNDYALFKYDESIYPPIENTPYKYAILKRNEWIVDNSDVVICYVKVGFGGAYKSYVRAKRKNKIVLNLCEV